jgi:hypothetical protein
MSDKRLSQLDPLENVPNDALLYVVYNGESYRTTKQKLLASIENRITAIGTITHADLTTVFGAGFSWIINGVSKTNASSITKNLTAAATGYQKVAIAVLNASNGIDVVYGTEVEIGETMVQPATPVNTLFLTRWDIIEDVATTPTVPVVGTDYVEKAEFIQKLITGSGEVSVVLDTQETNFRIVSDDITMIEGTSPTSGYLSQYLREDKLLSFINKTANPIVFKHSVEIHNFRLPNAANLTIQPNEIIRFRQAKDDVSICYEFDSLSRVGSTNEFRTYRTDDAGLESILELTDLTKFIDNVFGSDFILTAGLFPVNGELVIKNSIGAPIEMFGIANPETGDLPTINGNVIDEFTPFMIEPYALATLKKVSQEDFVNENWILTYEFENSPSYPVTSVNGQTGAVVLTKSNIGLDNVDNTSDINKPVSTAQQAAINAVKNKPVAYMAITSNIALSGNPTINSVVLSNGLIVLLTNQTDGKQNGLWQVQTAAWVRPPFFAVGMDVTGAIMPVQQIESFDYSYSYVVRATGDNIVGTNNLTIDVLYAKENNSLIKDFTFSSVTGVTTETLVESYEITAGKIGLNDFLDGFIYTTRTGVSAYTVTLKANTVNNSSTATTIASVATAGNFVPFLSIKFELTVKSGVIVGAIVDQASGANYRGQSSAINVSFDNSSNSVFLFLFVTPTNTSSVVQVQSFKLTK